MGEYPGVLVFSQAQVWGREVTESSVCALLYKWHKSAMFRQLYGLTSVKLGKTMALFGTVSTVFSNVLGLLVLKVVLSLVTDTVAAFAAENLFVMAVHRKSAGLEIVSCYRGVWPCVADDCYSVSFKVDSFTAFHFELGGPYVQIHVCDRSCSFISRSTIVGPNEKREE